MKTITIFIAMLLCFGCATSGTGNQKIMDASFRDAIQVGVTTSVQILHLLGEPENLYVNPWRYVGNDRTIPALCYVPLLDLTQKQTVRNRVVDIYFDTDRIVSEVKVDGSEEKRMFAVGTVGLITAGVGAVCAAGATPYPSYYASGHLYPGKAVINTVPTTGGGSMSTIKWYP